MNNKIISMKFEPTIANTEKYELLIFKGNLDTYKLRLAEEDRNSMLISDFGFLVGDEDTQKNFMKEYSLFGFSEEDRDGLQTRISKLDSKIKGNWIKWVDYNGDQLRVIKEEDSKYLLFVTSATFDKSDWTKLQYTTSAYKWVDKSEVEELE